jgi:hypothetical protein
MFTSNSVEAQTGIVEITDSTYEAVEAFVEFMYLDVTDKLEVLTKELYVLADFYDVQLLKVRSYFCDIYVIFLVPLRQAFESGRHKRKRS